MASVVEAAGDVIQHQTTLAEMATCQFALDAVLALAQPIERLIELFLGGGGVVENIGERGALPQAQGSEFGGGEEEPLDQECDTEIALPGGRGGKDGLQAEPAEGAENGVDMAVRQRGDAAEGLAGGEKGFALERLPQEF